MMRIGGVLVCALLCLSAGEVRSGEIAGQATTDTILAGCRLLVGKFQDTLKSELVAALKEGRDYAIQTCQLTAPAVSAHYSQLEGWTVRRTAERLRNPANAPDSIETAGLRFLHDDSVREFYRWSTDTTETNHFHYLKPIRLGPACVGCHGDPEKFSADVISALAQLYPQDKATGFQPGELRGAFSVTVAWPRGRAVADSLLRAANTDPQPPDK